MWKKPGVAVAIDPTQLVIGLYVWLDVRWDEHPFVSNRFMVKTAKDVAVVQSLEVEGRLYYCAEKSTAVPLTDVDRSVLTSCHAARVISLDRVFIFA